MIKILINGWGETLHQPLENFMNGIKFDKLHEFCDYNDYTSYFHIKNIIKKSSNYNIIHLNCRPDLFLFKRKFKNLKYIFESHGVIPGMNFRYGLLFIENPIFKLIYIVFYPILKILYKLHVNKLDLYYVSIPGLLDLAGDAAKWLPNPVNLSVFYKRSDSIKLDKNNINVFYPNGLRKVKNCKYALDLMYKIQCKYKNVKFYMINSHGHTNKYKKELELIKDNIIRLKPINHEEMPNYYSAEWDLMLGSFFPKKPYAMLNMIENEAMACKAPVLCCDLNEVIFEPLEKLEDLAYKIIENKKYRERYIKRNYEYIKKVHSCEAVAKIYEQEIKSLIK